MEYIVATSKIGEFYNNQYAQRQTKSKFSAIQDKIQSDAFGMSIDEWSTPNVKAHFIQTKAEKNIQLTGGINGSYVILHFVCEGETCIKDPKAYPTIINQNTNNLFYTTNNSDIAHNFKEGGKNTYFKIFLPYNFINAKAEQHPEVYEMLSKMKKRECPLCNENNIATTFEMKSIIEQIRNISKMGSFAPLYFETKIQELLILQLRQTIKIGCTECKYYRQYHAQLNKARNFIETHYQKSPTIAQIAKYVGMSETVLKANFKDYFNKTIYSYLFDFRMSIAQNLLADTSMTIAEIGDMTGYEHPSHFATAFKRKFGIPPVTYRKERNNY